MVTGAIGARLPATSAANATKFGRQVRRIPAVMKSQPASTMTKNGAMLGRARADTPAATPHSSQACQVGFGIAADNRGFDFVFVLGKQYFDHIG